jgi:hypothetical protein
MSALCSDDYYEDTAGQCGVIFTIEAILAKYGFIITDTDDDVIVLYLDDMEDTPVGSIQSRNEGAVSTDEKSSAELVSEQETIAPRVVTPEPQSDIGGEAADDVATTGPTARRIPTAIEDADDHRTIE